MECVRARHTRGHPPPEQRWGTRKSGWALVACLLAVSSAAAAPSNDQIRVERRGDLLELRWSDADERLQGTIHPAFPREGEPLSLSLHVGNFQGAEFDGPITLTFQRVGSPVQVTRTLTRQGVNWHTELTPDASGVWDLEVRYRHTHLKVLTAHLPVADQQMPRGLGWALITLAAGTALILGVRGVLRRIRATAPEAGSTGGASGSTAGPSTPAATPETATAPPSPPTTSEPPPASAPPASVAPPAPAAPPAATPVPPAPPASVAPPAPAAPPASAVAPSAPETPAGPSAAPESDEPPAPPADPSSIR